MDLQEFKSEFSSELLPLGTGGQKEAYYAEHIRFGKVAVKRLCHAGERSERELDIVTRNNFSHVPRIYEVKDIDWAGQASKVFIEEFIEGESLRKVIASGRAYRFCEIADFLDQGFDFVAEIYAKGIVHRDIKPENIILRGSEYVFIDFGIARDLNAASLTGTGEGGPNTPGYAAPELFLGEKRDIDCRSDLFSLGVVAYELASGVNPFIKSGISAIGIYVNTMTVTPVEFKIPGDEQRQLMGLISSLMSKDRYRRPADAQMAKQWLAKAREDYVGE